MKNVSFLILLLFITTTAYAQSGFLAEQRKYERVRSAIEEKGKLVSEKLQESNIENDKLNILFVAYKDESEVEIYAKTSIDSTYELFTTYDVCSKSGELGPKRKQGDLQVPEGFYYIDRFNPVSSFHLSLGINYPNQSDRRKSDADDLGGDIFIHGACVTIGCLPMTDDKIKEIYLYAVHARNNGQEKIPFYIFPFRMDDNKFEEYKESHSENQELLNFWTNIKTGYETFVEEKRELNISVNEAGDYIIQ